VAILQKSQKKQRRSPGEANGAVTEKQSRFVHAYLETGNARQSYRAAYGSKGKNVTVDTRSQELLNMPKIQALIEAGRAQACEKYGVSADRIIAELSRVAFANITDAVEWGSSVPLKNETTGIIESVNGIVLKGSDKLPASVTAAISEISQTRDGSLKVKLHDKLAALEKLGRHVGLFPQQVKGEVVHHHELEPVSDSVAWLAGLLGGATDIKVKVSLPD
jgi:phage terminase small subunit